MRSLSGICLLLLSVGFAALSPALAEELVLDADPDATHVTFTLAATMHTVEGKLSLRHGRILFDDDTGRASGELVLDALSAETGSRKGDTKMHEDVLESEKYPEIVFTPERMSGKLSETGSSRISLVGTIGIHGARHPVRLSAQVERRGEKVQGVASFVVPYVEWGMTDPSAFLLRVAKEVDIEVALQGTLSPSD